MLAHELRRRMAAVRVAGEAIAVLRDQGLDTTPMLDLLLAEVADLDQLAGEVLGDHRRWRAEPEPEAAVPDVAATVQAAARTVAVARGATVRVQAGVQAEVEGSPTMLRQAIENLIDNAAAHGGPDGVEVDVRADPAAGQVEVVVADRGDGGREVPSGHGIGLFVVRRFLEEAGGRSWVAAREGGGTLVGLRLPLRAEAEPDPLDMAVST
ncbi:MAG TPA: HAMP domain-containing sensor histidine kinase [Actinomycetota bacterium]|nr:HAMP domain-containing sensor histidine kinase [Actinomycetota bacterium]